MAKRRDASQYPDGFIDGAPPRDGQRYLVIVRNCPQVIGIASVDRRDLKEIIAHKPWPNVPDRYRKGAVHDEAA